MREDEGVYLLRALRAVHHGPDGAVVCTVRAVRVAPGPDAAGWLTGETLAEQGIETAMPNLPHLALPPLQERDLLLRVLPAGRDAVRLTVSAPSTSDGPGIDPTAHGIVVDPHPGPRTDLRVHEDTDAVTVDGPRIRVTVHRNPFGLTLSDRDTGAVLARTAGRIRQVAGLPVAPAVLVSADRVTLNLELGAQEEIWGFGEQFARFVRGGQRLRLRVADALGTAAGLAYKPAPVWHSTAGWLGLLNTGATVDADTEHTNPGVLSLSVACPELDLFLVAGATARDRLTGYTALTGRAPVPPLWALGFWLGRCRYHSAAQMLAVGAELRARDIPCDVLHLDPDWLVTDRLNCDFTWNTARFGPRKEFVADLARLGLRLSLWELPYLDPASPRHAEAAAAGYLARLPDGTLATVQGTPVPDGRPRALVDFTNPAARTWWQELHREFLDDGVAVFKTDFGEGLPEDTAPADGSDPVHAHNLYPLRYNATVSEATAAVTGRAPLVWGRAGWAGSHRYPAQWGGDAESSVAGMRATLRGGLAHGVSIPGPWGHDVGGFFGPGLTAELYVRWLQFGALSPLLRAHGLRPHEPWAFGERAASLATAWIRLRYSLLPYLWQVFDECARFGWPPLRALGVEFGDDEAAAARDDCFLLGSALLVVPIFDDTPGPVPRRYYLPAGTWTDLVTGERATGPGMHTEQVALERMPVLVREGTVLPRVPVGPEVRGTDDLRDAPWTLHHYGDTGPCELVGFDGRRFTAHPDGTTTGDAPATVYHRKETP